MNPTPTAPFLGDSLSAASHLLAQPLRAAGATDQAKLLGQVAGWLEQADELAGAYEKAVCDRDAARPRGSAAWARADLQVQYCHTRLSSHLGPDPEWGTRQLPPLVCHALMLVTEDPAHEELMRGIHAVTRQWDPDETADTIRESPPIQLPPLEGVSSARADAARAAAALLTSASRMPRRGDEDWLTCSRFIAQACELIESALRAEPLPRASLPDPFQRPEPPDTMGDLSAPPGESEHSGVHGHPPVSVCPLGCQVCAEAVDRFNALRAASVVQRRRFDEPDRYPYAAGKHTLHRSSCREVEQSVGHIEGDDSEWMRGALTAFAHEGSSNSRWATHMRMMEPAEAVAWIKKRNGPRAGTRYRLCRICTPEHPAVPATLTGSGPPR